MWQRFKMWRNRRSSATLIPVPSAAIGIIAAARGKQPARGIAECTTYDFELDPRLDNDSLFLTDWPLCRVLRMNDRAYPWLILVPRRTGKREIIDLSSADQALLWARSDRPAGRSRRR